MVEHRKVKVVVGFSYGARALEFSKVFEWDFVPFYGMVLFEDKLGYENRIEFVTNNYQTTDILYVTSESQFEVNVWNVWRQPVTPEAVDQYIENFQRFHWTREDNIDVDELKKLMTRDYERKGN